MDGIDLRKVIKYILLSLVALVSLLLIFWLRNEITLIFLYPYLRDKLVGLGLNIWLAKMIALPMGVWVMYISYLLFSRNKEKKQLGYIFGGATWAVWCLCMFFATRDYYFDPKTNEGTRCFAKTVEGYRERPCTENFDPTFGTPVQKVDQNIALSEWVKRHGPVAIDKIEPSKEMTFFTADGRPMYYYYEHPTGQIDIFNRPGSHPQFGVELNPITAEVVAKIFKQIDAQQQVPTNIVFHNDDGSVNQEQGVNLNHLKDLSDSLKSLQR
ncbi:MAG: hypothetical protein NTX82_03870 [Candidatus Parcubacteria bacterium]|nr:hypothetical protein [Candidatus Parcubacteria bacterium]